MGSGTMNPMGQLALEGMPRRLYACTPSRLTSWLDCPRRYRLTYLQRPPPAKGPPWAHNSLGAAVHNTLANWWRLPVERRTTAAAGALLEAGWLVDGFRDDEQSARLRSRTRSIVEGYVATLDPDDEPVGVERTVGLRTDVVALSGRVDRLDLRDDAAGGELVVVDYKTGRRPLATDDARSSLALAIYALAASRVLRRPCRRVELHHLPSGSVVGWEHTGESLGRQLRRAESIAAELSAADAVWRSVQRVDHGTEAEASATADSQAQLDEVFPPQPGPQCGWCDYRKHCPEGSRVAAARQPWDGLADEGAARLSGGLADQEAAGPSGARAT